jgi:uncharacterized protein (TIGR02300 family)
MSMKAARGTKRVCQSCGNKFYDLNRDPIICPICQAVFQNQDVRPKAALAGNAADDDDDEVIAAPAGAVEIVSLDEVAADESELPDLEGDELVDIDEDAGDLDDDDETFIEVEDDDGDDEVSGLVGGSREDDEEV